MGYSSGRNNSSLNLPSCGRQIHFSSRDNVNELTCERTATRALDYHIEVPQIVFMRSCRNSWRGICYESLGLLILRLEGDFSTRTNW
jgi:hypothetical protein